MGYLGKARGSQTEEQCHRTLSNLILKGKLREALQFICDREKGGVLQPDELAADHTGTINDTVTSVLEGKHTCEKNSSCATLEMYEETPIFIPVNIMEEAVESVMQNVLGSSRPGGTESEALQGWLLKFREGSTRLRTSVETFVDWLDNWSPPWATYRAFMSGRFIVLDKQPGVHPVGVGET